MTSKPEEVHSEIEKLSAPSALAGSRKAKMRTELQNIMREKADVMAEKLEKLSSVDPNIDPNERKQLLVQMTQTSSYSGATPPPEMFEAYERVLPGSADRILSMAENQAKHRQRCEKIALNAKVKDGSRGLVFGFIVTMAAIFVGAGLALIGREIAGGLIGSGGLIGLASVFIYGSMARHSERPASKVGSSKSKSE